jgi:aldose 1-epimerase
VVAPETNYPDPFGREWGNQGGSGMVVLQPGQSLDWKVRLEVFTPSSDGRSR